MVKPNDQVVGVPRENLILRDSPKGARTSGGITQPDKTFMKLPNLQNLIDTSLKMESTIMPDNIDYKFLGDLEGGCETTGYVPASGVSKSGVTIATGFDLGQRSQSDLKSLGISATLISKLQPYLGKKAKEASDLLKKKPLKITAKEGQSIDKAVKSAHVKSLKTKYLNASENKGKTDFFSLPAEAQTVIASVSFQYGVNLDIAAPKFWKAASSQNWSEVVKILKNFGDAYPTRRKKEAAKLEKIVK